MGVCIGCLLLLIIGASVHAFTQDNHPFLQPSTTTSTIKCLNSGLVDGEYYLKEGIERCKCDEHHEGQFCESIRRCGHGHLNANRTFCCCRPGYGGHTCDICITFDEQPPNCTTNMNFSTKQNNFCLLAREHGCQCELLPDMMSTSYFAIVISCIIGVILLTIAGLVYGRFVIAKKRRVEEMKRLDEELKTEAIRSRKGQVAESTDRILNKRHLSITPTEEVGLTSDSGLATSLAPGINSRTVTEFSMESVV